MANQNAQIIRKFYTSQAAFEADTSGVTDPFLAIITAGDITGDPAKAFGVKIGGAYTYFTDQTLAVSALQAAVAANTNQIATLSNLINQANGPKVFGSVMAPFGEAFAFPTPGEGIRMPMTYVNYTRFPAWEMSWIKFATARIGAGSPDSKWIRLEIVSGDVFLQVYASFEDAETESNLLASALAPETTPGLYPIIDADDGETVWGWVYTGEGMLNPSEGAAIYEALRLRDDFAVPAGAIIPEAQIKIPFKFYIGPTWSSSGTINFELRVISNSPFDPGAFFSFPVTAHGAEEGFVFGVVELKIINIASGIVTYRAWCELRPGNEALSQIIDIQPQQVDHLFGLLGDGSETLDLSCFPDNPSVPQFDLYDLEATYIPPAASLQ
jgi:hypothetical protein